VTITQSGAMLAAIYGREIARNLSANHMARVFFAPQELEDARDYSETLGYLTERRESRSVSYSAGRGGSSSVNRSEEKRALMLPQELREMEPGREIVILQGMKPIWAQKIRYFEDPNFVRRLLKPPEVEPISGRLQKKRVAASTSKPKQQAISRGLELESLPEVRDGATDEQIDAFADALVGMCAEAESKDENGGALGREVEPAVAVER
jgi:type IV secretion system protein VirD4